MSVDSCIESEKQMIYREWSMKFSIYKQDSMRSVLLHISYYALTNSIHTILYL